MNLFRNRILINIVRINKVKYSSQTTVDDDMPVTNMDDPFKKKFKRCVICINDIPLEYKNVRLLSQFISPYTGKQYDAHITGLCSNMHEKIKILIGRARDCGLMSHETKETMYLGDLTIKTKEPMKLI